MTLIKCKWSHHQYTDIKCFINPLNKSQFELCINPIKYILICRSFISIGNIFIGWIKNIHNSIDNNWRRIEKYFSKMVVNCTLCNTSFKNSSLLEQHLNHIHALGLPGSSSQGRGVRKRAQIPVKGIYKFLWNLFSFKKKQNIFSSSFFLRILCLRWMWCEIQWLGKQDYT